MRELSKVFQGVMLAVRDRFKRGSDSLFGANVTSPEVCGTFAERTVL